MQTLRVRLTCSRPSVQFVSGSESLPDHSTHVRTVRTAPSQTRGWGRRNPGKRVMLQECTRVSEIGARLEERTRGIGVIKKWSPIGSLVPASPACLSRDAVCKLPPGYPRRPSPLEWPVYSHVHISVARVLSWLARW